MASAPDPMATMPAARPSRPSIRLMALARAITHTAVMRGMTPGVSTMNPASGTLNWVMVTPRKYKMLAARTWPAIFGRRRHLPHVVDEPDGENGPGRQHHPQHLGRVREDRTQGRHGGGGEHGRQQAEEHGGAAAIGDGLLVHGALVGQGDVAGQHRQPAARHREGGGRPRRHQEHQDVPAEIRHSLPQQIGVGREGGAQVGHLGPHRRHLGLVGRGPAACGR